MNKEPNDVCIEQIDGMWTVFVTIGGETTQRTFSTKEQAENFAAGQSARLEMIEAAKAQEGEISWRLFPVGRPGQIVCDCGRRQSKAF